MAFNFENLQQWPLGFSNPARNTSDLDGNSSEEKVGVLNEVLRHTIIGAELFQTKVLILGLVIILEDLKN